MRQVTGRPIKLIGVGEKLDALEDFHPDRIAGRILGMGDVVSLVEKAAETIEQEEAERLAAKVAKGRFDLDDMAKQLKQILKMGGLGGIVGMLPGIGKLQKQIEGAKIDDKMVRRQLAIISSMTVAERRNPDIVKASRRRRIATGSGTSVQDVNKLLKQHQEMSRMVKQVSKLGQKGLMRHGLSALRPGGFPNHELLIRRERIHVHQNSVARGGAKKGRSIASSSPIAQSRDGRFIERIGSYNPMVAQDHPDRFKLDQERAKHWLAVGAQPTDRVARFLAKEGLMAERPRPEQTQQSQPKAKAQERAKAAASLPRPRAEQPNSAS